MFGNVKARSEKLPVNPVVEVRTNFFSPVSVEKDDGQFPVQLKDLMPALDSEFDRILEKSFAVRGS